MLGFDPLLSALFQKMNSGEWLDGRLCHSYPRNSPLGQTAGLISKMRPHCGGDSMNHSGLGHQRLGTVLGMQCPLWMREQRGQTQALRGLHMEGCGAFHKYPALLCA